MTCATPPAATVQPPQKVDTSLVMAQQSATETTITIHIICSRWAASEPSSVPAVIIERRCVSCARKCWPPVATVHYQSMCVMLQPAGNTCVAYAARKCWSFWQFYVISKLSECSLLLLLPTLVELLCSSVRTVQSH